MQELHTDFKELTNYLIHLFYQTNKNYSCTRTKIGKLLSIIAFTYALEDVKLFDETIYEYEDCGTIIGELNYIVCREEYFTFANKDDKKFIDIPFNLNAEIPSIREKTATISIEIRERTEKIFRRFGSYTQVDLSKILNPIIQNSKITNNKKEIDLIKFKNLKKSEIYRENQDNELINYLWKIDNIFFLKKLDI